MSDSFVYLLLQHRLGVPDRWFALLPLGTAAAFLLLAVPLGRLADKVGRWQVFLGGHAALLLAYVLLLTGWQSPALPFLTLALHGGFYAATDGVLMAAAAGSVPAELRSSGLALIQTGQAAARFACSIAFGAAWTAWGDRTALGTAAARPDRVRGGGLPAPPLDQPEGSPALTLRNKILVLVAALAVLAGVGTASVLHAAGREDRRNQTQADGPQVAEGNVTLTPGASRRIVFRNMAWGPHRDELATVAAADPAGPRTASGVKCLRFYAAAGTGICLQAEHGAIQDTYRAVVLDARLKERAHYSLPGIPTRARVSPSGHWVAWTVFVGGDSYAGTNFSTRTAILDTTTGQLTPSLEDFTAFKDGKEHHAADTNFWGVTFAADDRLFYATMATGGYDLSRTGRSRGSHGDHGPRERGVPLALPRRHPGRLQEAGAGPARRRPLAAVRPGSRDDARERPRGVEERRRPGGLAGRPHGRLRAARRLRLRPVHGPRRRHGQAPPPADGGPRPGVPGLTLVAAARYSLWAR